MVVRVVWKRWAKWSSSTLWPLPVPRFPDSSALVEVPPHVSFVTPSASSEVRANDLVTLTFDAPVVQGSGEVFVGSCGFWPFPSTQPLRISRFRSSGSRASSRASVSLRCPRARWSFGCPQAPCARRRAARRARSSVCLAKTRGR